MNCELCGRLIIGKVEGIHFLLDSKGNYWCASCVKRVMDSWEKFCYYEELATQPELYRNALIDTLKWAINEGYCTRPKEACRAEPTKCLSCWLRHLVGE